MKKSSLLAFVAIGVILYYVTGGGILFGLTGGYGTSPNRPAASKPAAAEVIGGEQTNPFMDQDAVD